MPDLQGSPLLTPSRPSPIAISAKTTLHCVSIVRTSIASSLGAVTSALRSSSHASLNSLIVLSALSCLAPSAALCMCRLKFAKLSSNGLDCVTVAAQATTMPAIAIDIPMPANSFPFIQLTTWTTEVANMESPCSPRKSKSAATLAINAVLFKAPGGRLVTAASFDCLGADRCLGAGRMSNGHRRHTQP